MTYIRTTTMANTVEITDIPLRGLGYRSRQDRSFQAGEFRQLRNCELYAGAIRTIPNIEAYKDFGGGQDPMASVLGIMGEGNDYVVIASHSEQWFVRDASSGYQAMWAPTSLPNSPNPLSFHRIVHFYFYNDTYYWITMQYIGDVDPGIVGTYRFWLHSAPGYITPTAGGLLYSALTHTQLFDFTPPFNQNLVFRAAFVQGERLWIATSERLFFSAATDHTNFVAPDGGFFDFQSDQFMDATFYRDTVYLLAKNACYSITYNTDPNVDSSAVQISNELGGSSIVVHDDVVYFANHIGMYSIINNNVDLFYKFELYDHLRTGDGIPLVELTPHAEYIYILLYREKSFTNDFPDDYDYSRRLYHEGIQPGIVWHDSGLYGLNMLEGSLHQVDYEDRRDSGNPGRPAQLITASVSGSRRLIFLCSNEGVGTNGSHMYRFVQPDSNFNRYGFDEAFLNTGNELVIYNKRIVLEVENWLPEGSQYMFKKFRNLNIWGELPSKDFQVSFAFDNNPYGDPIPLTNTVIDDDPAEYIADRPPVATRLPIMQRAKMMSIKFESTEFETALEGYEHNKFSLSSMAVAWTSTSRLSVNSTS